MKRSKNDCGITQGELKSLLDYDPKTGVFRWRLTVNRKARAGCIAATKNHNGYIIIGIKGRKYFGHRLAWFYVHGKWPDKDIDHINCIKTDNRIRNLREATHAQNHANIRFRSDNKTGFKGVFFSSRDQKYIAKVWKDQKQYWAGIFSDPVEAYSAYCRKAKELFGEFANFEGPR